MLTPSSNTERVARGLRQPQRWQLKEEPSSDSTSAWRSDSASPRGIILTPGSNMEKQKTMRLPHDKAVVILIHITYWRIYARFHLCSTFFSPSIPSSTLRRVVLKLPSPRTGWRALSQKLAMTSLATRCLVVKCEMLPACLRRFGTQTPQNRMP